MSKITVKHYLNKDLKPQIINGISEFPVYVQVIYNRNNYKFKSENDWFEYLSDEKLSTELIKQLLNAEINRIIHTIELLEKNNLKEISSKNIYKYSQEITKVINKNYSKYFENFYTDYPEILKNVTLERLDELCEFLNISSIHNKNFDDKVEYIDSLCKNINSDWRNSEEYLLVDYIYGQNKTYFLEKIGLTFGYFLPEDEDKVKIIYESFKEFLMF